MTAISATTGESDNNGRIERTDLVRGQGHGETELEEIIAFLAGRLDQETTDRFVKELEDPDSRLSRVLQGARDAELRLLGELDASNEKRPLYDQ